TPVRGAVTRARRQREVEYDESRQDEEEHRRQRVARAELDLQILAGERGDVGGIRHPSGSLVVARDASRDGSCVATTSVRLPASSESSWSRSPRPTSSRDAYGSRRAS